MTGQKERIIRRFEKEAKKKNNEMRKLGLNCWCGKCDLASFKLAEIKQIVYWVDETQSTTKMTNEKEIKDLKVKKENEIMDSEVRNNKITKERVKDSEVKEIIDYYYNPNLKCTCEARFADTRRDYCHRRIRPRK